jgi:hypothetical protein
MIYRLRTVAVLVVGSALGAVSGFAGLAYAEDGHRDDPGVQACRHQVHKNEHADYDYLYAGCDPSRYNNRGSNGNSSKTVNGHADERKPIGQGFVNGLF